MLSRWGITATESVVGRMILKLLRESYKALSRKQKIWLAISILYVMRWAYQVDTPRVTASDTAINCRILELLKRILSRRYWPSVCVPNGHVNTFLGLLKPAPELNYVREIARAEDGGFFALDWSAAKSALPDDAPTLLMVHGINGDSDGKYLRWSGQLGRARQWRVVCLVLRGCGGVKLSVGLHSAAVTHDIRMAVKLVSKRYPLSLLFVVGYSLGANTVVKYLGEETRENRSCPVAAAVSIGNPWTLDAHYLKFRGFERFLALMYEKAVTSGLTSTLRFHMEKTPTFFAKRAGSAGFKEALRSKDLFEFDKLLTAPIAGWKDAHEYRDQASSAPYLPDVRVPLLCINAEDDPIISPLLWPSLQAIREEYMSTIFISTKAGGHLGWNVGLNPNQPSWVDYLLFTYFEAVLQARAEHLINGSPPSVASGNRITQSSKL